jgi:DNA polymerase-3 subunit gamma/tau
MATQRESSPADSDQGTSTGQYVVIARRYRPQTFDDLIGQQQVATALKNAINTSRVGHAYLFTGARGIGKTSTARILAKALNCEQGPTATPCNQCDACRSISTGDDVDVLEIDGASNRGIDEIRQLRSNVNIRPSRARFKIYIIDEVHMLTVPAFNALLKTLEEPPPHVKFMFCTTDAEKVPITVLSRCQRFDLVPVQTESIVERLQQIVAAEGMLADNEALELLARRAGGSMRDSQSLLEQLLSFCEQKISAADVHQLLGTAESGRLSALVKQLIARQSAVALEELDRAIAEGVDPGQLAEQLIGHLRDVMAATVGCEAELMLHTPPADHAELASLGKQLGLETLLAATQILDESLVRMRQSSHVRTLLEMALVRICHLDQLDELSELVAQLAHSTPVGSAAQVAGASARSRVASAQKKIPDPHVSVPDSPQQHSQRLALDEASAAEVWKQALAVVGDMTSDHGARCERVAIAGPNRLVVYFRQAYTLDKERCERPERKSRIEQALSQVTGQPVRVTFELVGDAKVDAPQKRPMSRRQRIRDKESNPLVRRAIELFEAEVTDVDEPRDTP